MKKYWNVVTQGLLTLTGCFAFATHRYCVSLPLGLVSMMLGCGFLLARFAPVGTKSVLFGAHCFLLHPWFVALAWWKLYGFPWSVRLWVAFFVHDLGYWGKPNMDGPEGETHPLLGAWIMHFLFWRGDALNPQEDGSRVPVAYDGCTLYFGKSAQLCLLHSRYYAKKLGMGYSRLCVADKLAFVLTPRWLYLPMARATGELEEYLRNGQKASDGGHWTPTGDDAKEWHAALRRYMAEWVEAHRDGEADTWTSVDRHAVQP